MWEDHETCVRCGYNAARTHHWCGSRKLLVKQWKLPIKKTVEDTTSTSIGFPNKHSFLVPLTENAGFVVVGSGQCCYPTFDLTNKDTGLAEIVSWSAALEVRLSGHPWYLSWHSTSRSRFETWMLLQIKNILLHQSARFVSLLNAVWKISIVPIFLATSWTVRGSNPRKGEILHTHQTGPGTHPASCTSGTWSVWQGYRGRGVALSTQPYLAPKLKKEKSYRPTSFPLWTFIAYPSVKFTLHFTHIFSLVYLLMAKANENVLLQFVR